MSTSIVMAVIKHYHCDQCTDFAVIHNLEDSLQKFCGWCGKDVKFTGLVEKIEGDSVVSYQDGKEVERRLTPNAKRRSKTI